ncbi:CLUMA_CG002090, isoform A, partial [Clunio marinus]
HLTIVVFDSWGKFQSGLFERNVVNVGSFTECIEFRHRTEPNNGIIQGQYCLVGFKALNSSYHKNSSSVFDWREIGDFVGKQNLSIITGFCLPASCSEKKVVQFLNEFLPTTNLNATKAQCQTNDPKPTTSLDVFAKSFFNFYGVILIASTIYDVLKRKRNQDPNALLAAFSIYTNGKQLFNTSEDNMKSLSGIRFFSLLWIIFGHRVFFQMQFPISNFPQLIRESDMSVTIFTSFNLAVDTFFVMGALLATMSCLSAFDCQKFSARRMILHRYIRYTPCVTALLLYVLSIWKFQFEGPFSNDDSIVACQNYWWSTLLHIQNYVNGHQLCLGISWYLSADFQLYLLPPAIIYPAWRWGWKHLWIPVLLAIFCCAYIFGMFFVTRDPGLDFIAVYLPTHARMGPWMVGIILGFIIHRYRGKNLKFGRWTNIIGWFAALLTITAILIAGVIPINSKVVDASLLAFRRLAWAIALAWIIFACQILKTGGIIRWLLSLRQWQPIARMSLSIFLYHTLYQATLLFNSKDVVTLEEPFIRQNVNGDILGSFMGGVVLYLSFERPFQLIEKYFYNLRNNKKVDANATSE